MKEGASSVNLPKAPGTKSRAAAFFLALFFGPLGISEFYMRRKFWGLFFLIVSIVFSISLFRSMPENCFAAWRGMTPAEIRASLLLLTRSTNVLVCCIGIGIVWISALIRAFRPAGAAAALSAKTQEEKDRTPDKVIEFQPDALEIKNSRLPLAVRLCVWVPFVVIVAAIVWASVAEVDVVVSARGKVITDKPTIVLKPYDRVFVRAVKVKVGDLVEKDQILIEFNPEIYLADRDRLINDVRTCEAQYARFQAEFQGKEYVLPEHPSKYEREQYAIFKQRKEYYNARIKSSDASIQYYLEAEKTKRISLASMKDQLKLIQKLCGQYEGLQKKQAVSWRDYTDIVVKRLEMEGNVATAEQSLQELHNQRESAVAGKEAFIQEWRNTISENMVSTQSKLKTAQSELKQAEQLCGYTELRSPCRAVVHELASFSENSGVREAEALITLIPIDNVMIEAEVRPMDIAKVHVGSEARIKLDAYPFQKYDTLDGVVIDISENTIQKDQRSLDPEASSTYYRTRIAYSGTLKHQPDRFRMIPGMEVQVEIRAGRRRIITYVTYPLIKALDTTAREP